MITMMKCSVLKNRWMIKKWPWFVLKLVQDKIYNITAVDYPSDSLGDVGEEAGLDESDWVALLWWPLPGGGVDVSVGINPSFILFFCFIRRFWNHIFTCVSLSARDWAISILLARVKYLLKWNSFSSSVNCLVVKFVRPVLLAPLPSDPPPSPFGLCNPV